jgi:hypothetical protein
MAAGQGFKTFTSGDVLTAADVNGYLMQGVGVFADATERDAEITSPEEGQFAYLKDTNVTTYYTGSAWANLDTTGMLNPMTTTGDTIYSSSGSTPARLGIGTAGQILQVNSGATAPEWATPASGGGITLLSTTNLTTSGSSFTVSGINQGYQNLLIIVEGWLPSSANSWAGIRPNNTSDGFWVNTKATNTVTSGTSELRFVDVGFGTTVNMQCMIYNYSSTSIKKAAAWSGNYGDTGGTVRPVNGGGSWNSFNAITSIVFTISGANNISSGTAYIYGVK